MNVATKSNTKVQQPQSGMRYALSQYFLMLSRWGSKFVYLMKWSVFNFGFHLIVSWGNFQFLIFLIGLYKSYHYAKKLKMELGPQTVKGGLAGDF